MSKNGADTSYLWVLLHTILLQPEDFLEPILDKSGTGYFSSRFAAGRVDAMSFRVQMPPPFQLANLFFRKAADGSNTRVR